VNGWSNHYNYHVVSLLAQHPSPAPEVAAAVRQWLATQLDLSDYHKQQLEALLRRAAADR
jgi:hypothetical protein